MPKYKDRRLCIELVPESSWNNNLRSLYTRAQWDKLRKEVYAAYKNQCGVCGGSRRLAAHEVWEYDDVKHTQTLAGLIALCSMCHHVKHIGLAHHLASQDKLDIKAVIGHYCWVNQCTRADFDKDLDEAEAEWKERSQHQWTLVLE